MAQRFGFTNCHTRSWHPIIKDAVERFHLQLKAPTMAPVMTTVIPIVLRIRTSFKEDIKTTELVYGEPLNLPGKLFSTNGIMQYQSLWFLN